MKTPILRLGKKPGPRPKGLKTYHVGLPEDLAEWALNQPRGLSDTVREALMAWRQQHDAIQRLASPS